MTLLELIEIAKGVTFVPPPDKSVDQYDYDTVQYFALSETLKHHVLIYAAILACEKHSIMKILLKNMLKDYIVTYGGVHMLPSRKR